MFILGSHPKIRRNLTKATKEMHFRRQLTAVAPETACVSLNKGKSCFYVQKNAFWSSFKPLQTFLWRVPTSDFIPSNR